MARSSGDIGPPKRASFLRNLTWMAAGTTLVKPMWFLFITALCMRVLGLAEYGVLTATLSLAFILMLFGDFGTTAWATSEIAKDDRQAPLFLVNLLGGRLALEIIVVVSSPLIALALGYSAGAVLALSAACAYTAGLKLVELWRVVFRAYEVFRLEALSIVSERLLVTAGGVVGLLVTKSPAGTLLGMSAGVLVALVGHAIWGHRRLFPLRLDLLDRAFIMRVYRQAFPLGAYVLFAAAYIRLAPVLLELLDGAEAAGLYGAAGRVLELVIGMPIILVQVLLPRLATLSGLDSGKRMDAVLARSLKWAVGVSLAVSAFITMAGPAIIHILDPNPVYQPAGDLLQILIWSFPLITTTMILTQALVATGHLRAIATVMASGLGLLCLLNILLIPTFSIFGSATALLISELAIAVGLSWCLFRSRRSSGSERSSPRASRDRSGVRLGPDLRSTTPR